MNATLEQFLLIDCEIGVDLTRICFLPNFDTIFFKDFNFLLVNRRLDEWVSEDRIDKPVSEDEAKTGVTEVLTESDISERKITRNQKRKHDEINHVQKVCLHIS